MGLLGGFLDITAREKFEPKYIAIPIILSSEPIEVSIKKNNLFLASKLLYSSLVGRFVFGMR